MCNPEAWSLTRLPLLGPYSSHSHLTRAGELDKAASGDEGALASPRHARPINGGAASGGEEQPWDQSGGQGTLHADVVVAPPMLQVRHL